MCIILDTNIFSAIIDKTEHSKKIAPVLKWITEGRGKVVFGGTKYRREMSGVSKIIPLFAELGRMGKLVILSDKEVDAESARITNLKKSKDFDDEHLLAIVDVSGCRLICTLDKRSFKYLNDKTFYKRHSPPLFYTSLTNKKLLKDDHIVKVCKPCDVPTRKAKKIFKKNIKQSITSKVNKKIRRSRF